MFRVGFGYDSHRFSAQRPLMLAGVRVNSENGLAGHSDADVVLHAITDAILGPVTGEDIGEHFPDTDPQWKDADSSLFVKEAVRIAKLTGYRVGNCDVTVLAEKPRLSAYKLQMRTRIAELLEVAPEAVSVKAKTNEGMGFVGRGEGIVAMAVVTLQSD